jgi:hypothetical protein
MEKGYGVGMGGGMGAILAWVKEFFRSLRGKRTGGDVS